MTFNSRFLGFFHAPAKRNFNAVHDACTSFNSRYLGFFHAPYTVIQLIDIHASNLSIPVLGIFPCTYLNIKPHVNWSQYLSIPVTWDFSMHLNATAYNGSYYDDLSIPVTWDFSMHHERLVNHDCGELTIFQFPLLGIFPCTST